MKRVNLDVHIYRSREPDDDEWDSGDTDGSIERVYVSQSDYDYGYRGKETELEFPFYVVYAGYYAHNTFGKDFDAVILGIVKTVEEAEALRDEALASDGFGMLSNGFYVPEILDEVHIKYLADKYS